MTRYILYLLLLYILPTQLLFGQGKIGLGINTKVGYSLEDFKKASNLVISYGILSEFALSDNKFLSTGVEFISYGSNMTDLVCVAVAGSYCPTYVESQFNSITVPVSFRLELKQTNNVNFYISTGVSPYFIRREKNKLIEPLPQTGEVRIPELDKWSSWMIDVHSLFLNIAPGVNISLNQKFRLHTGIFIQYDVLDTNSKPVFGLDISLFYNNNQSAKNE